MGKALFLEAHIVSDCQVNFRRLCKSKACQQQPTVRINSEPSAPFHTSFIPDTLKNNYDN
jgi:hypothetical protein